MIRFSLVRLLPAPFRDDLGQRVPAAVVTRQALRLVKADPMRRPALRELKLEGYRGGAVCGLLIGIASPAAMQWQHWWTLLPGWSPEAVGLLVAVAVGLAFRLLSPVLLPRLTPRRPAQSRRRFLAALLCPACAHDLKGVPPREDGVTVCPECGAAWRVEGTKARSQEGTEGKRG